MDHYVRIGLFSAWGLFIIAMLVWWTRRNSSRHYSYSERATVILQAIQDGIDVGIIYWSKSEHKFLRRVVTPESLDGYSMRGIDHTTGAVRIFKITRIRLIQAIPAGAPKRPPSRTAMISPVTVAVIIGGAAGLGLLAFALFRAPGPQPLTNVIAPPLPNAHTSVPSTPDQISSNSLKISGSSSEHDLVPEATQPALAQPPIKLANKEVDPVADFLDAPPPPAKKIENWYIVVVNHKSYKVSQVATILQTVLRYRSDRAVELEQTVHSLGEAVVWSGPKERAEKLRQLLEGYDLNTRLERSGSASTATNATATVTNVAAVATNEPASTAP